MKFNILNDSAPLNPRVGGRLLTIALAWIATGTVWGGELTDLGAQAAPVPEATPLKAPTPESPTEVKADTKTDAPTDSGDVSAEAMEKATTDVAGPSDGPRIAQHAGVLKALYPSATQFKESVFLPAEKGGSSFIGLVARLLGQVPNRDAEGLNVRRYLYTVGDGTKTLAVVHGSSIEAAGQPIDVFVYFTPGGTIEQVRLDRIAPSVVKDLTSGGYLQQFSGHATEEFEVVLGKKGRIKSRGLFFSKVRRPSAPVARTYFDKILRAVSFNCAFMDVAYFITQHPDMADKPSQAFPEGIEITNGKAALSGPEAFARAKSQGNPIDGKPFLLQDLKPAAKQ